MKAAPSQPRAGAPRSGPFGVIAGIAFGAAAGFVAGRFLAPMRGDLVADSPRTAPPNAAPASAQISSSPLAAAPAERTELATGAVSPGEELARLRERIELLEAELARMRARNELKYGSLYAEIAAPLLVGPEAVAADPRALFAALVRLVDETGLSLARPESETEHERKLEPD